MMISRRHCLGFLGAGMVLAPTMSAVAHSSVTTTRKQNAEKAGGASLCASELLAPLTVGSSLGDWRIERLGTLHAGAVGVVMSDSTGERFQVDICARDRGSEAPCAPAHTQLCELFVANGGKGKDPTSERQGLAAMALAEVVKSNEYRVDLKELLTLRVRLARYDHHVVRRLDG
jgi:hypothetical protein